MTTKMTKTTKGKKANPEKAAAAVKNPPRKNFPM